jgi:hypothetical protein
MRRLAASGVAFWIDEYSCGHSIIWLIDMKFLKLIAFALAAFLIGCATSDPMVTGKPQHWKGKPSLDLRTAWGDPTRVIPQANGDQVWEYSRSGDFTVPKGESMSLGFRGLGGAYGGSGGFSMEKRPEDRMSREEELYRFKIRKEKIVEWYAARFVDGRKVWEDH